MSLSAKHKALLIFAISMGFLAVFLYAGSWYLMYSSIRNLESEIASANLQRAITEYDSDINSLDAIAQDWSQWKYARRYVLPGMRSRSRTDAMSLSSHNCDYLVIYNNDNLSVYTQANAATSKNPQRVPSHLLTKLRAYISGNPCGTNGDCRRGVMLFGNNILQVVVQRVIDPEQPKAVKGYVVACRILDSKEINQIQRYTNLHIEIYRVKSKNLPADVASVLPDLKLLQQTQTKNTDSIFSYQSINDLYGRPALVMKVTTARTLASNADFPRHYVLLTIIGAASLFGFMMLYLIYKTILNRMMELRNEIQSIAESSDPNARVHIAGGDEIALLAKQVNEMLESVQSSVRAEPAGDLHNNEPGDSSVDVLLILDHRMCIHYINNSACHSMQTTSAYATGKPINEVLGIESGSELIVAIEKALSEKTGSRLEFKQDVDEPHYLMLDVVPLGKPSGKPDRVLITGKDITYTHNLEGVIEQQLRFEDILIDTIPIPVVIYDPNGNYISVNRVWCDEVGLSMDEVCGRNVADIMPKPIAERYLQICEVAKGNDDPVRQEIPLRRKDGTERQVIIYASAYRSAEGDLRGIISATMDITELKNIQNALQASEARYRGVVESQNDLVMRCNTQGCLTFVNQACSEIFGNTVQYLLGSSIQQFILPEDQYLVDDCIRKLLDPPYRSTLTHRVQSVHDIIWIEWECAGIRDEHGNIVEFQLTGRDVSAQKQMHEELEQRVAERTLELAKVNAMLKDQLNFAHLHAQMANRMIGITPERLQSRFIQANEEMAVSCSGDLLEFWAVNSELNQFTAVACWRNMRVYSDTHEESRISFGKCEWLMERLSAGRNLICGDIDDLPAEAATELAAFRRYEVQSVMVCPVLQQAELVGFVFMGSRRSRALWGDGEAALLRLYGETLMIGYERSQAQMEVAASETRFRTLFERAAIGIALTDVQWQFISVNHTLAQMLGYTEDELTGLSMKNITYAEDTSSDSQVVDDLLNGKTTEHRRQLRLICKDGKEIWVSMIVFTLDNNEGSTILVSTIEDITVSKQAQDDLQKEREMLELRVQERTKQMAAANQELARANRMKDEFLANMSHELRTPLNAIIGISEAMDEGAFGTIVDMQRDAIGRVRDSGFHLLSLINDILDLSKIEAGKVMPHYDVVDINNLCSDCMRMVKDIAHKKKLNMVVEVPYSMAPMVADSRRLKQILVNLITNAVKFTPEHGRVTLNIEQAQDGTVVFKVTDSGIGISEEDLAGLFKPFQQVDSGLNRKFEGTGLGLALVKKLAELHGGTVDARSTVGVGSTFIVRIPYRPTPEQLCQPSDTKLTMSRAMVVASDVMERLTAEVALQKKGIEVRSICSTLQFPDEVSRYKPELVIMHLDMEDGAGWHLLDRIKNDVSNGDYVLIAITDADMRQDAMACGANACLSHPLEHDSVQAIIERYAKVPTTGIAGAAGERRFAHKDSGKPRLILLAEDNEISSELFVTYLTNKGYMVELAVNGREAYEMAVKHNPDIILMDVQMPEVNGLDATRMIRQVDTLKDTPIIMLTALAMQGDRERCMEAGADDYLSKPVRLNQLLNAVAKYVG